MKKILVIEDDEIIKSNICDLLEERGFDFYSALNGKEGIKQVLSVKPDLIICDILMPGLNGYEVKKALSLDEQTAIIPFIYLSAKMELSDVRKGMDLGADDYLIKPFDNNELLNSIETRLNKAQKIKSFISLEQITSSATLLQRYFTVNNNPELIDSETISYIKSEGNYSHIYFEDQKKVLVRKLIKQWLTILPDEKFIKIHQSIIVSLEHIEKIERLSARNYKMKIRGYSELLPISQRCLSQIKEKYNA